MQKWGPWTQETLDRLKADVKSFFAAYYSELRSLTSERRAESLPEWIKGTRLVHAHACLDGVMVAHIYADKIPPYMTVERGEGGNPFKFDLYTDALVRDLYPQLIPPRRGGGRFPVHYPPDYQPGEPFGQNTILAPLEIVHPLDEENIAIEQAERLWTRLEYADFKEAVAKRRWGDFDLAKEEAELALELALERE